MGELMMMKKTTSALAVAALLGTGAASAATFQVDENTSFSVGANIGYAYVVNDGAEETTDIIDNGSDFYFGGEHTSNGLTTSLYLEIDGLSPTEVGTNSPNTDNAQIGLAGDFGKVEIGNDLGTYGAVDLKDLDIYSGLTDNGNGSGKAARYTLPSMGSVSAAVGINTSDDADDATRSGSSIHGSLAYDLGAGTLSFAFDDQGREAAETSGEFYGVAFQTELGGVDTRVSYEKDTSEDSEVTMTALAGIYSVGKVTFTGAIQSVSGDDVNDVSVKVGETVDSDSVTQTNVHVGYQIADNMSVYLENTQLGAVDNEGDQTSLNVFVGF
jgi:hypothetical protein